MTEQHPITPPSELVQQWDGHGKSLSDAAQILATQAARWGADQELEACCEWLEKGPYGFSIAASAPDLADDLRAARRPKPPSLKEQALADVDSLIAHLNSQGMGFDFKNIRRALEQLND